MRIFEEFGPNIERMTAQQLEEKTGVEKMLLGEKFCNLPAWSLSLLFKLKMTGLPQNSAYYERPYLFWNIPRS